MTNDSLTACGWHQLPTHSDKSGPGGFSDPSHSPEFIFLTFPLFLSQKWRNTELLVLRPRLKKWCRNAEDWVVSNLWRAGLRLSGPPEVRQHKCLLPWSVFTSCSVFTWWISVYDPTTALSPLPCSLKYRADLFHAEPVCVYTKCLLSSPAEVGRQITNTFQRRLTRRIYGFIKVWICCAVNGFSSGGHCELFCARQHVELWVTMTSVQQKQQLQLGTMLWTGRRWRRRPC